MDDKHLEKFIEEVQRHEGFREEVYLDSLGNPTCGWGHHLAVGSRVDRKICEIFLEHDIANAVNDFYRIDKDLRDKLNPVRRRVICNMIFNLGLNGVLKFKKMWKAIKKEDWDEAKTQMLNSLWTQQVGHRAFELANLMKEGKEEDES